MLYTIGNLRRWRPIPARAVVYAAVSELVIIAVANAPAIGGVISRLGPGNYSGAEGARLTV
jgi:hypothetical protein